MPLEEKFFELVYKIAMIKPGVSDKAAHALVFGVTPYFVGKYASKGFGLKNEYANLAGIGFSVFSEILWETVIEPKSKYHHHDIRETIMDLFFTVLGLTAAYILDNKGLVAKIE